MKDEDLFQDAFESLEEEFGESSATSNLAQGAYIVDTSNLPAMLKSLIAALGEDNGNQLFSNMTGVHVLDGKLIPSHATEYDTLH